jgi:Flp pilus assembly protein TadD
MASISELLQSAVQLHRDGQWEAARNLYEQALLQEPRHPNALNLLGVLYCQTGQDALGIECLRQSIEIFPRNVGSHFNLAKALHARHNYKEAEDHFLAALEIDPDHADSLSGLAAIGLIRGQWAAATKYCQRVLQLRPDDPEAHFLLGTLLLTVGDFERGWPEFEYRTRCPTIAGRKFSQPRWDGSSRPGEAILLYGEYGLGDVLQFIRYTPGVSKRAKRVFIEVPSSLLPLLESSGFPNLVAHDKPLTHFDYQLPLTSLPGVFKTTLSTIPAEVPYIFADASYLEKWRPRLAMVEGFKVGVHWQGSLEYQNDRHRSMQLANFEPLASVPRVRLISLQKGPGEGQIADVANRFSVVELEGLDEEGGAFMDTAAVMHQLDLVITSDSAVAHLAGAMGIRTWLVIPFSADWRWFLDRDDCPWYPTMRLFRQTRLDDWPELFARIATELSSIVNQKT